MHVTTSYHQAEEASQCLHCPPGDLTRYESSDSPQEVRQTANNLEQATNDALEAAFETDHSVNTDELSGLIDRREKLELEQGVLDVRTDELRRNPVCDE